MANPRLLKFWAEIKKVSNSFKNDQLYFGFYVIDKEQQTAEIEGDPCLKKLLFEASTLINAKWTPTPQPGAEVEGETPTEGVESVRSPSSSKKARGIFWDRRIREIGL